MMVPAIAFAWWFAALPAHQAHMQHVQPRAAHTPSVAETPSTVRTADDGSEGIGASLRNAERVTPKLVNPAMVKAAESFINLPMGSERYATVNGKHYVFVLEQHYHPPGFVGAPNGYHKGVTMYELR